MIIEDEPVIRQALVKMIQNLDIDHFQVHSLTEVEYAEHAIDHLEKKDYDFVFVDLKGGKMNGLDLIKDWHEKKPHTEWIIISGYDRFDYAQRAIVYEVKEYLLKPVTKGKLKTSVERCLKKIEDRKNNFISVERIEEMITSLTNALWNIDEENMRQEIKKWQKDTAEKSISMKQYNDIINYILKAITAQLKEKGATFKTEVYNSLEEEHFTQANIFLERECKCYIEAIKQQRKGEALDPIAIAKQYILDHIDKDLTLEDVARKIGFNPSYFSQYFRRKTGQTFVQYRTYLRMERAKEILLRQDVRIIDIPYLIGLNDHPHFTKIFKEHTGYTPSGYRRKMGML